MTIGERIKKLREKRGIKQTELADAAGISKQSLYKYENGIITNIPSDKIESIASGLSTTPAYLMGWENDPDSTVDKHDDNILRIAGRDGRYIEKRLTDEQVKALEMIINQLPEAPDDL